MEQIHGEGHWNLYFRRRLKDEEIVEAAELCNLLEGVQLNLAEDERRWLDGMKVFTVKSASKLLNEERRIKEAIGIHNFLVARVWECATVPPKVSFWRWTLLRGRILAMESLKLKDMTD